jgi:hypothetical protein
MQQGMPPQTRTNKDKENKPLAKHSQLSRTLYLSSHIRTLSTQPHSVDHADRLSS